MHGNILQSSHFSTSNDTDQTARLYALRLVSGTTVQIRIEAYLHTVLSNIQDRCKQRVFDVLKRNEFDRLLEQIFNILSSQKFCYLSKKQSEKYKSSVFSALLPALKNSEPLPFYYDIGGGYHASIQPGKEALGFTARLGEFLILSQIVEFDRRVKTVYPPGVKFTLVIDNLCARLINDIPLENTKQYCASLRSLIAELGLADYVELLVESEFFSIAGYQNALSSAKPIISYQFHDNTEKDIENVSRFLGRPCTQHEAAERMTRYAKVSAISERHLASVINGPRMTQRATDSTLCFRSFPGSDSRIQAGTVVITQNSKGKLHPLLLTSRKRDMYHCFDFACPILPSMIDRVTYAEKTCQY